MISKKRSDEFELVFRALAHASRRHVLESLSKKGQMLGGEIADLLDCSWPTTVGHLKCLEDAGMIVSEWKGREKVYKFERDRMKVISIWLKQLTRN